MYSPPEDHDRPGDQEVDDDYLTIAPASLLPTFDEKGGELVFVHNTVPLTEERRIELHNHSQEAGIAKIRLVEAFEARRKEFKAQMEKWERQYTASVLALDIGHEVMTKELRLFFRLKTGIKVWKDLDDVVVKEEPMTKADYTKVSEKPRR